MKRISCPYLGLRDDPTTALDFPSPGNYCHHARPVAPVKGSYQEGYCLTEDHFECPVYRSAHPIPLPPTAAAPIPVIDRRRVITLLAIPLIIASIAILAIGWNRIQGQQAPRLIPETGSSGTSGSIFGLDWFQEKVTRTPFSPDTQIILMAPTLENCPMKEGWITYTVNPTDSLYRLSVIYGVSVEEFQRVNCMGTQSVILPGQVIYVPYIPTNTPFFEATADESLFQTATIRPPVIRLLADETQVFETNIPSTKAAPTATATVPRRTNTPIRTPTKAATASPIPVFTQTQTLRPTNTLVIPPTATLIPSATSTPAPTQTPFPTRTRRPTRTPMPPATSTPEPQPTNTWVFPTFPPPPTDTPIPPPPTDTPEPLPSDTPIPPPPTDIPPPPTDTPEPPPPPTDIPPTEIPPTDVPPTPPPDTPEPSPSDTPVPSLSIIFDLLRFLEAK